MACRFKSGSGYQQLICMNLIKNKITLLLWNVLYYLVYIVLLPLKILYAFKQNEVTKNLLAIEAGEVGWNKIDVKETYQSAIEFYGKERVTKVSIINKKFYISEVIKNIKEQKITHYFYDPRSSDMENISSLITAIFLVPIFAFYNVTPIAILPDFAYRKWRYQCAFLTMYSGFVISVLHNSETKRYFPHKRLMGPQMMPFSNQTVEKISHYIRAKKLNETIKINFTGSLYEPRKSKLELIRQKLKKEGIVLNINARDFGGKMIDDEDYWKNMVDADIVITTADQYIGTNLDNLGEHLIYRYTEALACNTLLVAPIITGSQRFIKNKVHYYGYKNIDEAVEIIKVLSSRPDVISTTSKNGHNRIKELVNTGVYWIQLEVLLKEKSVLK